MKDKAVAAGVLVIYSLFVFNADNNKTKSVQEI